jgi:RHS repeat-associated protein
LGSAVAVADSTGTIQTSYTYDPFGSTSFSGVAGINPFQFTGRENEGNGLYYYRARYYSSALGRFISEDPDGLLGGDTNFYSYVLDSPTNFRDPSGKWLIPLIIGGIGGAIEGGADAAHAYACGGDAGDVAKAFARGFVGGFVGGVVGEFFENPVASSIASNAAEAVVDHFVFGEEFNPGETTWSVIQDIAVGGIADHLVPKVHGGSNFNSLHSPRTFGPKAQEAYSHAAAEGLMNAGLDAGRNCGCH